MFPKEIKESKDGIKLSFSAPMQFRKAGPGMQQ